MKVLAHLKKIPEFSWKEVKRADYSAKKFLLINAENQESLCPVFYSGVNMELVFTDDADKLNHIDYFAIIECNTLRIVARLNKIPKRVFRQGVVYAKTKPGMDPCLRDEETKKILCPVNFCDLRWEVKPNDAHLMGKRDDFAIVA